MFGLSLYWLRVQKIGTELGRAVGITAKRFARFSRSEEGDPTEVGQRVPATNLLYSTTSRSHTSRLCRSEVECEHGRRSDPDEGDHQEWNYNDKGNGRGAEPSKAGQPTFRFQRKKGGTAWQSRLSLPPRQQFRSR